MVISAPPPPKKGNLSEQEPGTVPSSFEKELAECFSSNPVQEPETRNASQMRGLSQVPGLVKSGHPDKAWEILCSLEIDYPDFDFIFTWKAHILHKKGDNASAEKVLQQGLEKAKAKHLILERLGFLAWESGNLEDAVKGWVKSIVLIHQGARPVLWEPFLYLSHVARVLGCSKEFEQLQAAANSACQPGEVDLTPDAAQRLAELSAELKQTWVRGAIEQLCLTCLGNNTITSEPDHTLNGKRQDRNLNGSQIEGSSPSGWPSKKLMGVIALAIAVIMAAWLFFPQTPPPASENEMQTAPSLPQTGSDLPTDPKTDYLSAGPTSKESESGDASDNNPFPPETTVKETPEVKKIPSVKESIDKPTPTVPVKTRPSYIKHKTKQPDTSLIKKSKQ